MSRWSKEDLEHIAKLARLRVKEDEVDDRLKEFEDILDHIETLRQLDTRDVEPTSSLSMTDQKAGTPLAKDKEEACLDRNKALSNAPDRQEIYFRVPRFIEEGKG